ncbi:MAG: exodeoxyribonuclease VII large subunit [Desulfocapsa sp.]|nr:exodeoxyribonuclease VII large subunit [Desulfocapsa sp.]
MSTVYSVTTLTKELKNLVESKYRFIQVLGEISNLKRPYSGHAYFTLKDDRAQLRAVLFKGSSRYLEKPLEDGQQVICHGRISIYEPRGDYQLIVDSVDFQGSGLLQLRFEKLKKQLAAEGLFNPEKKQEIQGYPKEIVLITSPTGAAVHDFLKIWRQRDYPCNIKIFPVRVQGNEAAEEIGRAIVTVNNQLPDIDCIVLCRGGGSLEDLWPFNEESLARSIAGSRLPVVSAIGHEIDFTISDFCADLRAATPTAAAELLLPNGKQIREQTARLQAALIDRISSKLHFLQQQVNQNRRLLGDMNFLFTNISLRLDHAFYNFYSVMKKRLHREQSRCEDLFSRLHYNSPVARVQMQEQHLQFATEKLLYLARKTISDKENDFGRQVALLDAISPLATLARGYSISSKIDPKSGRKTLLRDSEQVKKEDRVELRLHKGRIECEVLEVNE